MMRRLAVLFVVLAGMLGTAGPAWADTGKYYQVGQRGDYLFQIALDTLGDGNRYPEIVALNRSLITDPMVLRPGSVLELPGDAKGSRVLTSRPPQPSSPAASAPAALAPPASGSGAFPVRAATLVPVAMLIVAAGAVLVVRRRRRVVPVEAPADPIEPLDLTSWIGASAASPARTVWQPEPTVPAPIEPAPVEPDHVEPFAEPDVVEPPVEPAPIEPTPIEHVPVEPASAEPDHVEPFVEPDAVEPFVEPDAVEPFAEPDPVEPDPVPGPRGPEVPESEDGSLLVTVRGATGAVEVRLSGDGSPAYAWERPGNRPTGLILPARLGELDGWELWADLSRAPDIFTVTGDPELGRELARSLAESLHDNGIRVTAVGDALGADLPGGWQRYPAFPTGELGGILLSGVVFSGPLRGAELATARALADGSDRRAATVLVGRMLRARWSAVATAS